MPTYRSRTTTAGRNMAGARALWRATGMYRPAETRPRKVTTALKVYASMATSADKGAVRDLSRLTAR